MPITVPAHVHTALEALTEHRQRQAQDGEAAHPTDLVTAVADLEELGHPEAATWLSTRPLTFSRAHHEGHSELTSTAACTHEWIAEDPGYRACEVCGARDASAPHQCTFVRLEQEISPGRTVAAQVCSDCGSTRPG